MSIIFKYAVKYNGKYYPANTPITEKEATVENPVETVENPKPKKGKVKKDGK